MEGTRREKKLEADWIGGCLALSEIYLGIFCLVL